MTRHFACKSHTLSVVAMFVAGIGALTLVAAPAIARNPIPFIDQPLVPDATAPGGPAFTLTVNGAGFVAASVVNWNGSPRATTFVSSSQLTATILASDIAIPSTASVTVVNPTPGGGVSNVQDFSIAAAATSFSFQPVQLYNANEEFNYSAIAIADLNGDGIPDVVIASQNASSTVSGFPTGDGSVEIFLGNGDGTFQLPVSYNSGGGDPNSLAIADVNGDGKLDIVVGNVGNENTSGGLGILLGNGDGTFQNVSVVSASYAPSLVVADVNGDGKLDVIIATCCQDFFAGAAGVLLGNGDGTFQPATFYSSGASGVGSIAVADVNGDGKLDLVLTGPCPTTGFSCAGSPYPDAIVSVLLGNGNGTFQSPLIYDSGGYAFGGYPSGGVTVADVNADGKPDLLVANCQLSGYGCQNATVAVLLGNGNGTFQPAAIYYAGTGGLTGSVSSIAVADMNMDGKVDVVATTWFGSEVGVLLGNGNGTFQPVVASNSGAANPSSIAIADLNGDGKPDAAMVNCGVLGVNVCEGSLGVLLNDVGFVQTSTTTTVSSSLKPSIYGQTVTFTATVSSASGLPTGTVIFYDGSTAIGSATLVNRSTSISVSTLAAGSQPITAVYQGCSAFGGSTSTPLNQVVHSTTTTTALTSSENPAHVKQRVTYTATVASQYGGEATGKVTFQDGGATLATVTLSNGQAEYSATYQAIGVHSITAAYSGDLSNAGSMSPTLTEDINGATKTVVTTSGSPSFVGQAVTFTATVTSVYGMIPNGEVVTFYHGAKAIGTGTTAAGVAELTTSSLPAGTGDIRAAYSGAATFVASSGTVKQVVNKYSTTTALVSSLNPSNYGQAVTFTATVTPTGPNAPTGDVVFKDGTTTIGATKLSSGVATLTKSNLAVGSHSITAEYEGNAASAESTSAVLTQVVN